MKKGSIGPSEHGLIDNYTQLTVCCGRGLPTSSTRKMSIQILFKALYISIAFPHDEEANGPIGIWYELSKSLSTGIALAVGTTELRLSRDDLLLFSSFRNLRHQLDIVHEEIVASEAYLNKLETIIKGHISLQSAKVLVDEQQKRTKQFINIIKADKIRELNFQRLYNQTEERRVAVLGNLVDLIKKRQLDSNEFRICHSGCAVKNWFQSYCSKFIIPTPAPRDHVPRNTDQVDSASSLALPSPVTLSVGDSEGEPLMQGTTLESITSPPFSTVGTSSSDESFLAPPKESVLVHFFEYISKPKPVSCSSSLTSSSSPFLRDDKEHITSIWQDTSDPSCVRCSICRKEKEEIILDPIDDCYILGVAFSLLPKQKTAVLEGMPVCADCYNEAVSFLHQYYRENYNTISLLIQTMKTFRADFEWRTIIKAKGQKMEKITEKFDVFLRRRLLIKGSVSIREAAHFLQDSNMSNPVILKIFREWPDHTNDIHFVASSETIKFHPGAINNSGGKLINMGLRAAEYNSSCYETKTVFDEASYDRASIKLACKLVAADIVQYIDQSSKLYIDDQEAFQKVTFEDVVNVVVLKYPHLTDLISSLKEISSRQNQTLSGHDQYIPLVTILHCLCRLVYNKTKRNINLFMQDKVGYALGTISLGGLYDYFDGTGLSRSRSTTEKHMLAYCQNHQVHSDWMEFGHLIPLYNQIVWILCHLDKPGVLVGTYKTIAALRIPQIQTDNNERKNYSETKTGQQVISETLVILYRKSIYYTVEELKYILFSLDGILFPWGLVKAAHASFKNDIDSPSSCYVSAAERLKKSEVFENEVLSTCIVENSNIFFGKKDISERKLTRDIIRDYCNQHQTGGHDTDFVVPLQLFARKVSTKEELRPTLECIQDNLQGFWVGPRGNAVMFGADGQVFEIAGTLIVTSPVDDLLNGMFPNIGIWHALAQTGVAILEKIHPDFMRESTCLLGEGSVCRDLFVKWHSQDTNIQFSFEYKMSLLVPCFITWMKDNHSIELTPESDLDTVDIVQQFRNFLVFLRDPQLYDLILSSSRYLYGMDGIRCDHNEKKLAAISMQELYCYKSNCYNYASYYMQWNSIYHRLDNLAKRTILSMLTVSPVDGVAGRSKGNCEVLENYQMYVKQNFPNTSNAHINERMGSLKLRQACKSEVLKAFRPEPVLQGKRGQELSNAEIDKQNSVLDEHDLAYMDMFSEYKNVPSYEGDISMVVDDDFIGPQLPESPILQHSDDDFIGSLLPESPILEGRNRQAGTSKSRYHLASSNWREVVIKKRIVALGGIITPFCIYLQRLLDRAYFIHGQETDDSCVNVEIPLSIHINEQHVPLNVVFSYSNLIKDGEKLLVRAFELCQTIANRFEENGPMHFNLFAVQNCCRITDMVLTVDKESKRLLNQRQITLDLPLTKVSVKSLLIVRKNMENFEIDRFRNNDLTEDERRLNTTLSAKIAGFPTCFMNELRYTVTKKTTAVSKGDKNDSIRVEICHLDASVMVRELLNQSYIALPPELQTEHREWRKFSQFSSTGAPEMAPECSILFLTLDTFWRKNNKKLFQGVKCFSKLICNFLEHIAQTFHLHPQLEIISVSVSKYYNLSSQRNVFSTDMDPNIIPSKSSIHIPSIESDIDNDIFANVPEAGKELWHIELLLRFLELLVTRDYTQKCLLKLSARAQQYLNAKTLILDGICSSIWSPDKVPIHIGFDTVFNIFEIHFPKISTTLDAGTNEAVATVTTPFCIEKWCNSHQSCHNSSSMSVVSLALYYLDNSISRVGQMEEGKNDSNGNTPSSTRDGRVIFNMWIQSHDVQTLLALMLHMQTRVENSVGSAFVPRVTFSLQNLSDGKSNTSCTVILDAEFFKSISERCTLFPKEMTQKQKTTSFVLLVLIYSSNFNPSMSIFKEQGKEPFALLLKIMMDITAHYGHSSAEVKKSIWLSNDQTLCNVEAIHLIYSLILFKSGTGGLLVNFNYGEAIVDSSDASKITSPFAIDSAFGSYFTGQKTKLKAYQQYPGVEGFPMASHRVQVGFMDLLEGSHVRRSDIQRSISTFSNTVQLFVGSGYVPAIPITPYLYMMYTSNMEKCFFTKRCHHTTTKIQEGVNIDEKCRKNCSCVKYHYFNVPDLIPSITQTDIERLIAEGIFCNAQCGRQKLSKVVMDTMTPERMTELLSVFSNPSTKIGHQSNIVDCDSASSASSATRPRTDSAEHDERRELIPDSDEGISEEKVQDDIEDYDDEYDDRVDREREE